MNHLTRMLSLLAFFVCGTALASGSGTGPRPTMDVFMTKQDRLDSATDSNATRSAIVDLGISGGGVGPRPEMVRLVGQDQSGAVIFNYKASNSLQIETHSLPANQFTQPYLDALRKSELSKSWESVSAD